MPEPAANSAAGYLWLYRFCHTTAGNLTTAFGNKLPGLKTIILGLTIPLLFMAPACAARYTIHPGALSTADSVGYDALLIAQAAIDWAPAASCAITVFSTANAKPALAYVSSCPVLRES